MAPRPERPKKKNLPAIVDEKSLEKRTALQQLTPLQKRLVIWLASGKPGPRFAVKNAKAICPKHEGSKEKLNQKARARVRKWQRSENFRQALWDWSVNDVDLASPMILQGVVAKAAAGRVDAARLALEITGRHAPNVDVQPAAIQIVMNHVPRPQAPVEFIEGEAEELEPEDEAL